MPLRSLRTELWHKLYTRYQILATLRPAPTEVGETIIPTTSADDLLGERLTLTNNYNIGAGATGLQQNLECPEGKRRTVTHMSFSRTSGDNEVANVRYRDGLNGVYVKLIQFPAAGHLATSEVPLYTPIHMKPGDVLCLDFDGTGVGASVFTIDIAYIEEDIF